jgi:hypothetical protein
MQREADMLETAKMYMRGETQAHIASIIGVSPSQIKYDIKMMIIRWRKEADRNIDERKAEELAKINNLEYEYWAAWKESQKIVRTKTVTSYAKRTSPDGVDVTLEPVGIQEIKLKQTRQTGDPRFLEGVLRCIEKRLRIFGIEDTSSKLQKVALAGGGEDGEVVIRVVFDEKPPADEAKNAQL